MILGVALTVLPKFRELYYGPRTKAVGDASERRLQKLWLGEELIVLRLVAANRSSGAWDFEQSFFAILYLWVAVDLTVASEGGDKVETKAA